MNKNNFTDNLKSLYIKKPINQKLINQYINSGQITFFNWEFFEQKAIKSGGQTFFQFDYDLKGTKTYKRIDREIEFYQLLKESGLDYTYWKIIPDEEISFLWPEVILKTGKNKFEKDLAKFEKENQDYVQNKLPGIKVKRLSELIESFSLGKIYADTYSKILTSFNEDYRSDIVNSRDFWEDVAFRRTHYSEKPILPEKLIREYAIKMFSIYSAETETLFALQKQGILPNLILVSNESERAIKKYEILQKINNRPLLPKIFVL